MLKRPTLTKSMLKMIIGLAILLGIIFGFKFFQLHMVSKFLSNYQPPPTAVTAQAAKQEMWQQHVDTIGTIVAIDGVEVTSQASGEVSQIFIESGQQVKQGQVLVQLDDSIEQAQKKVYQAQLDHNEIEFNRQSKLFSRGTVSKDELDKATSNLKIAEGNLEQTQALINQKAIKAPFNGTVGISNINIGEYIKPADPIVTLQNLEKLYVDFTLPEIYLQKLYEGQTVQFTVDSFPGQTFNGKVAAINPKIDINTHNVDVRAVVDNPNTSLIPGMFADINLIMRNTEKLIIVPSTAVTYSLYGDRIYVVKGLTQEQLDKLPKVDALKSVSETYEPYPVEARSIKVKDQREGLVGLSGDIKAGEIVITSNQQQLKNDSKVIINNNIALPTKIE